MHQILITMTDGSRFAGARIALDAENTTAEAVANALADEVENNTAFSAELGDGSQLVAQMASLAYLEIVEV